MKRKCIFLIILMGMITACGTDKASEKAVIPPKAVKQEDDTDYRTSGDNVEKENKSEETANKLSDEDFLNNIKKGLEERWDLLNDEESDMTPEKYVDSFVNGYVAVEKENLGLIEEYEFKDYKLKSLAEKYVNALDVTANNYSDVILKEDEIAETKFNEATKDRQDVVQQLMDEYGLKFDEQYKADVEEFLGVITEVRSTCQSGYDIEQKLKNADLCVDRVGYGRADEGKAFLVAIVTNNKDRALKNAEIAFVAWDENDIPIALDADEYIAVLYYDDIDVGAGSTNEFEYGILVDAAPESIGRIGAIVTFGEFYGGDIFENPYTDEWTDTYLGEKYEEKKPDVSSIDNDDKTDTDTMAYYTLADFYASITSDDMEGEQFALRSRALSYGKKYYSDERDGSYHIDFVSSSEPTKSDLSGSEKYEFDAPYVKLVYEKGYYQNGESTDGKYILKKVSYRFSSKSGSEINGTYWSDTLKYKEKNDDRFFDSAQEAISYYD